MRNFLFSTVAAVGFAFGAVALADPGPDAEAKPDAVEDSSTAAAEAPKADCSALEGEAKTTCESAAAEPAAEKAAEPESKAKPKGKAKRSNSNRMEWVHEDE